VVSPRDKGKNKKILERRESTNRVKRNRQRRKRLGKNKPKIGDNKQSSKQLPMKSKK
jgi:hypothetical protein